MRSMLSPILSDYDRINSEYADIDTSVATILLVNSVIIVGTTFVKSCGENIFLVF